MTDSQKISCPAYLCMRSRMDQFRHPRYPTVRSNHGRDDHTPETQRRKPSAGRTSLRGRTLTSSIDSTAEEIRGDEYF
ncbi:hypothetical protein QBC36DRAFT_341339 [Triangularia setosa]|uniref:Uncharacterized protein n=1 Tax=Triangularia setosa TaxID=2587417 RepID=A0AAN7A2B8_9PEZI|nr:hypothetical protein QBC36DRAFT_341339 [Podospora setosa]